MPRPVKQLDLDFAAGSGDPPTTVAEPPVMSVGQLTRRIRDLLEAGVGQTWVEGEVSNLRNQSSGHRYFTLKDESAQLACVLFARSASSALGGIVLADGLLVELFGDLTVYEARGQYQLVIRRARQKGAGALHARFEQLKSRLEAEGLFDPARKRPLPRFPRRIGVVTSPTGAALQDFLNVLHRRHPGIAVIINPVRVQGRGAAAEIAAAIASFGARGVPAVDVIVVTRGGGSLEDLWEFNEEVVARAVAASSVPVVSAVGHEIDFTICDFAADYRAPTPSAAAEILSADAAALSLQIRGDGQRLERACLTAIGALRQRLEGWTMLHRAALRRIDELAQQTDRFWDTFYKAAGTAGERTRARFALLAGRMDPATLLARIALAMARAGHARANLIASAGQAAAAATARLDSCCGRLAALDPAATLRRGFTITLGSDGRALTSRVGIAPGSRLITRFSDGDLASVAGGDAALAGKTTTKAD